MDSTGTHVQTYTTLDAHAGGEPLRLILSGVPELRGESILARRAEMLAEHDHIRRALMWVALNVGRQRANFVGTFAVSVYSGLGAESLHPLSVWTTLLNYGVIAPDGPIALTALTAPFETLAMRLV